MSYTFYEASSFDQDIGNWNVGAVAARSTMPSPSIRTSATGTSAP